MVFEKESQKKNNNSEEESFMLSEDPIKNHLNNERVFCSKQQYKLYKFQTSSRNDIKKN